MAAGQRGDGRSWKVGHIEVSMGYWKNKQDLSRQSHANDGEKQKLKLLRSSMLSQV